VWQHGCWGICWRGGLQLYDLVDDMLPALGCLFECGVERCAAGYIACMAAASAGAGAKVLYSVFQKCLTGLPAHMMALLDHMAQ
jgi:hypothetical protein